MTLSYVFTVASVASLLVTAFAGYTDNSAFSEIGSSWNSPAAASVFSNQKKSMPKNATQAVELLRFVTAYQQAFETLVDITPYSALLRSAADTDGDLSFFAFIDTWVGNNTPEAHHKMSLDSQGQCSPVDKMEEAAGAGGREGNGWGIEADLVFWPRTGFVDTRPRESMTISSGFYGSYGIGGITTHEGTLTGNRKFIELDEPADFTGTIDAEVYACPGGAEDVKQSYTMGHYAKRVLQQPDSFESVRKEVYQKLTENIFTTLSAVNEFEGQPQQVELTFDPKEVQLEKGMPVWYEKDDIAVENGTAAPGQAPGDHVGSVIRVEGNKAIVRISGPCVPGSSTNWLPRLRVEKRPNVLARAKSLAQSLQNIGKQQMQDNQPRRISLLAEHSERARQGAEAEVFRPFLVAANTDDVFTHLRILGQVKLAFLRGPDYNVAPPMLEFQIDRSTSLVQEEETVEKETEDKQISTFNSYPHPHRRAQQRLSPYRQHRARQQRAVSPASLYAKAHGSKTTSLTDGDKVCILARRSTGRVFERTFNLPTFFPKGSAATTGSAVHPAGAEAADRVLLQFTSTGHGWDGSTEKCGEFCHAIYHINVNGKSAANVTEWRECSNNPVNEQRGTWTYARDGWCPGSVEPGLYIDMTEYLKNDRNHISVDLSVWSSNEKKYEKYTNYGNFINGGNEALLDIGATLFIYDGAAVEAIKDQTKAYTAAERALREGSSAHNLLKPAHEVMETWSNYSREVDATADGAMSPETEASKAQGALSAFLQMSERTEAQPATAGLQQPTAFSRGHKRDSDEEFSDLEPLRGWDRGTRRNKRQFLGRREPLSLLAQGTESRYNFEESKAPWYTFDSTEGSRDSQLLAGAKIVPAFRNGVIQINTREIEAKVQRGDLPEEWGHVALHLKLGDPPIDGARMDNWDRVGSLGLVFKETAASTSDPSSRVTLHPSTGSPRLKTRWELARRL